MLESQKLFKQAADLFEQAKTALVKGDNTADDLQKQAEETLSRAEKVKVIEEQQKALKTPIYDIPLPGGNGDTVITPPAVEKPENDLNKSLYQLRYVQID